MRIRLALSCVFLLLILSNAFGQTVRTMVLPSATDPAIDTFDDPHAIYFNPAAKPRQELLIFLPGTNGKTGNTTRFCTLAADEGYHVICLMYPDTLSATVCWNDADREAFTKFRREIIEGQDLSPRIAVDRANSIENRLIKLLVYLNAKRPTENWGAFLTKAGEPVWERVALAGQSQGGGHAALIACRHRVARVLMFSSPKDYSRRYDKPAAWYSPSVTPASHYFAFVHEQDKQGCSYAQQLEILKTIGMNALGEPTSVDKVPAPYAHSHILTTNYPGTPVTSLVAHGSEVSDRGTPRGAKGEPLFLPVWRYMLTAETEEGK